jgi:hypothetical protein
MKLKVDKKENKEESRLGVVHTCNPQHSEAGGRISSSRPTREKHRPSLKKQE